MLEIEIKVRVPDLKPVRARLLELGAVPIRERYRETNTLYDFRDGALYGKQQALRLRTIGRKAYLTFKGTPQKSRRFKVREEFETEVKNGRQLRLVLKALGLVPVVSYEKQRTVFKKGRLKICLDETAVGSFIEFEGDREKIVRFAKLLKIPRNDWIKLDYIQLLKMAGKGGAGPYSSSLAPPMGSEGNSSS
ncbi:MAG: class IV adenylate cyclase [Candidatus Aminicenantes bacterium]|nr:class IV adenylate cyclase [Candidatus Aminicenantes bacterium]